MTGSGTSSDPFIITSVRDFDYLSMIQHTSESFYKLGCDIDFSDEPIIDRNHAVYLNMYHLDGGGHTIRGVYMNEPTLDVSLFCCVSCSYGLILENLNVEAEICGKSVGIFRSMTTGGNIGYVMKNCRFVLNINEGEVEEVDNTSLFHGPLDAAYIEYSTISIRGSLYSPHSLMRNGSITGSQMRLDMILRNDMISEYKGFFRNTAMADTGFFGRIEKTGGEDTELVFAGKGKASNCYQVIEYQSIDSVKWDSAFATACFYDSEHTGDAVVSSDSNSLNLLYALTEEQCKDAEYLRSIGFSCEGET